MINRLFSTLILFFNFFILLNLSHFYIIQQKKITLFYKIIKAYLDNSLLASTFLHNFLIKILIFNGFFFDLTQTFQ